ncbi:MAG: DUF2914 domain-containing protein [Bacteroidetes bacterium]|nr:DUF2914 domain-containing protein [Bacteroidota bacterium]
MTISSMVSGFFDRILERYRQNERVVGWFFFLAGIVWDALTLRRIDNFIDNALLLSYLLVLTFVVVSDTLIKANLYQGNWAVKIKPWLTPITQFLLGALLSAIVIFYARSVAWASHLGFWVLLVASLVANEFLHRKYNSLTLMLMMLFGCSTFIFAWLFPVLAGSMSPWFFRLATLSGLALSAGVLLLAVRIGQAKIHSWGSVPIWSLTLFAILLNVGYEKDWIPPVPMSVTSGGVYQRADKVGERYELEYLTTEKFEILPSYGKIFYYESGDAVSCFTSIFAPTDMNERIFHVWERFDAETESWRATDRIGFTVSGGRDHGYRGLTRKRNVTEGAWRIVVETARGKILSRIPFEVVPKPNGKVRWVRKIK